MYLKSIELKGTDVSLFIAVLECNIFFEKEKKDRQMFVAVVSI